MTKVKFHSAMPDTDDWISQFATSFDFAQHKGDTVTYVGEQDSDLRIRLTGNNLDVKLGDLVGGKVTGFEFSYDGDTYFKGTDANLKATDVQEYIETAGIGVLIDALMGKDVITGSNDHDLLGGVNGRDRILGKGGDDTIHGGQGDDRLTGGGGSDTFNFYVDDNSRDVVTDFDANGGLGDQDQLNVQGYDYEVHKLGKHDTLITFDDEEIVLRGVKPSEIDASDFAM